MKNPFLTMLLVTFAISTSLFSQKSSEALAKQYLNNRGEVILTFSINDKSSLTSITKEVSIVHYDETTKIVKVMANKAQFASFLQKKIPFTVTSTDNIVGYKTMTSDIANKATTFPLNAYPTYADYVTIMNEFAATNPTLCKVENIGATTEGDKSLLFVKLSDNVASNEKEPRIMYTSSMHGDEIAGYPMMLTLIDYLLDAYKDTSHPKHVEIKNLLDTSEVWINPLANPDGTFSNSANNTSVANATRGNANNVDLNRNYPDPDDGPNPDGNAYQTETLAFMNFADSKHFVLSANFHGGVELINYPWDTYAGAHPDEDYFIHVSEEYRDFCQANSPSGYFDELNNGITNGYAWYEVQGGRQDYQIYNQKGREVTVELSNSKTPNSSELESFWNYNRDALIAFLKQVNYGISGVVTDAVTNQPIAAQITVIGKENYESWVPTELPEGDYYRPIKAGTYSVLYEAECYESVTLTGVTIADYSKVVKDVQLTPIGGGAPTGLLATNIQSASATISWQGASNADYDIRYRVIGNTNWTEASSNTNSITITGLDAITAYETQVRSNCSTGASSPYSTSINFTTLGDDITYCASQGNDVNFEYIDFVGIGGLNNPTTATSGYSDYTSLGATDVSYGVNTITLSVGFASTSYTEFWGVWIDYNKNGTFETSEQVVTASTTSTTNQTYDFSIPSTALSGETRMRVSMKYNAAPSVCETFAYGEVEDYILNIGGVVSSKKNDIENNLEEISLFPNPIEEGFLFIKGIQNKNSSFRVINFLGQTVMNSKLSENKINVTNLTDGMYILKLTTDQKTVSKRFVVTK